MLRRLGLATFRPYGLHGAALRSLAPTDAPYQPSAPLELDPQTTPGRNGTVMPSSANTSTPFTMLRRLELAPFHPTLPEPDLTR